MLGILSALYFMGHIISSTPKEGFTLIYYDFYFYTKCGEGSHFIEISYFGPVMTEIFLLSTFQDFHKMSTQSLKPLLKKYLLLSLCLLMSV